MRSRSEAVKFGDDSSRMRVGEKHITLRRVVCEFDQVHHRHDHHTTSSS